MARVSFTLRKTDGGSYLQATPSEDIDVDNDSALRGDALGGVFSAPSLPPSPSVPQFGASSTFSATPADYGSVLLKWDIGTTLSTAASTSSPVPVEISVRYSSIGEPMSPLEGSLITTITSSTEAYSFLHGGIQEGSWAYYSLFVRYESTTLEPWYERAASLVVLVPKNYQSTDLLWSRIPEHYRLTDTSIAADVPEDLQGRGALYRLMSVFGWELDRARTLTHYLMRQKDPDLSTPEVLDALAYELGIDIKTSDLGSTRLRNIIGDIRYLREFKGTVQGVQQWLTAISGCPVYVRPLTGNVLTTAQSEFTGTITATTNPADVPSGNEWVVEGSGITISTGASGLTVSQTGASGVVVARCRISAAEQAQKYRAYVDLTSRNDAQVLGMAMSSAPLARTSLPVDGLGLVQTPYPQGFVLSRSYEEENWFQMPVELGIPGDGTLTTAPMYLSVFLLFDGPGTSITLNNLVLNKDEMYPYTIDVYSQRVNLLRDPQFYYGTNASTSLWHIDCTDDSFTAYASGRSIGASLGGASVTAEFTFSTERVDAVRTLLEEAVLWLDPEPAVIPSGAMNDIPVLLGIPYYASVDDTYNNISGVSLISKQYGVLASSTEVAVEKPIGYGTSTRKYWTLYRDYDAPWLPRSIEDCYLIFFATLDSGEYVEISRPLLESYNYGGEYFDGDTVDGGWLQTSTVAGSIRDYRWGDAGQHLSFSYFTSDFQRTRNTIDRLLPSLIPVTQSVTLTDDNYNRVFGYTGTGLP